MVDAIYPRLYALAVRLITQKGKSAVVVQKVKSGPAHAPVITTNNVPCKLVDIGYKLTERNANLVEVGDKIGLISPDIAAIPTLQDDLQIDGETFHFLDIEPLNPGGLTVLYEYHARK